MRGQQCQSFVIDSLASIYLPPYIFRASSQIAATSKTKQTHLTSYLRPYFLGPLIGLHLPRWNKLKATLRVVSRNLCNNCDCIIVNSTWIPLGRNMYIKEKWYIQIFHVHFNIVIIYQTTMAFWVFHILFTSMSSRLSVNHSPPRR